MDMGLFLIARSRHFALALTLVLLLVPACSRTTPAPDRSSLVERVGSTAFLQLEAERGFHCDAQTLLVVRSLCRSPSGKQHATLVGIPKNHLALLEAALRTAKLKPVSFSLGIGALQSPGVPAGCATMP